MSDEIQQDGGKASPSLDCCRLEVEVTETRRRYVTIELSVADANKVCSLMAYNPKPEVIAAAEAIVKAAAPISTDTTEDSYEIGYIDVLEYPNPDEDDSDNAEGMARRPNESRADLDQNEIES